MNFALGISGATLGHRSPQTVNRYAHVAVGPVRQAVQQPGDALLVAGGVKQPAKVEKVAGKNGLSGEAMETIRREIMGVAG